VWREKGILLEIATQKILKKIMKKLTGVKKGLQKAKRCDIMFLYGTLN